MKKYYPQLDKSESSHLPERKVVVPLYLKILHVLAIKPQANCFLAGFTSTFFLNKVSLAASVTFHVYTDYHTSKIDKVSTTLSVTWKALLVLLLACTLCIAGAYIVLYQRAWYWRRWFRICWISWLSSGSAHRTRITNIFHNTPAVVLSHTKNILKKFHFIN